MGRSARFADPTRHAVALADLVSLLSRRRGNGLLARTRGGIYVPRSVAASGGGIAVADGDGVAGDPTVSLDTDLQEIAALANVAGDILYTNGSAQWARLAKGTDGQVLTLASGIPSWAAAGAGGGSLTLIGTVEITASTASADFENGVGGIVFDDTYQDYLVIFSNLVPVTDDVGLRLQIYEGGSWRTGASDYYYLSAVPAEGLGSAHDAATATAIHLNQETLSSIGNATGESAAGWLHLYRGKDADNKYFKVRGSVVFDRANAAGSIEHLVTGRYEGASTANVEKIRLFMESGNISTGRFALYGVDGLP